MKLNIVNNDLCLLVDRPKIINYTCGNLKIFLEKDSESGITFGSYIEYIPSCKIHYCHYIGKYIFEIRYDL